MYTCRTCHVAEPATSPCVYQNKLNSQVGDTAGVTQDVGSDPTVGLPEFCTYCGEEIACSVCGRVSDGAIEGSDNYVEDDGGIIGEEEEEEKGDGIRGRMI